MGADSSAENTPNAPAFFLPNLSAQAQKFWISMKKCFVGRPYSVISSFFDIFGHLLEKE
jgi:hypothetical protein